MNEEVIVEQKRNRPPRGAGGAKKSRRFTVAEKLRAVRLYREEGFSQAQVCEELKISHSSLEHWLKAYRLAGEAGLQSKMGGGAKLSCPRRSPKRSSS